MRNFALVFLEVAYAVLQHPAELPVYLKRIPRLPIQIAAAISLAALSSAMGVYTLRDYYDFGFVVTVPVLFLVHATVFTLWGFLFGAVVDIFVRLKTPGRPEQVWQMVSVALLASFPLILYLPFAFPARFAATKLGSSPLWFMLPAIIAMHAWSVFITLKGLQYLYELSFRNAVVVGLQAGGLVLMFPPIASFFIAIEFYQLLS